MTAEIKLPKLPQGYRVIDGGVSQNPEKRDTSDHIADKRNMVKGDA